MTVGELAPRISSAELTEWAAFDRIEPLGNRQVVQGLRALLAMTFNINRGKDTPAVEPEDFLKGWEPPPERDLLAEARALEAHFDRLAES